jgi:hypothetical protein
MAKLAPPTILVQPPAPPAPNEGTTTTDESESAQNGSPDNESGETSDVEGSGTPLFQYGTVDAGVGTVVGTLIPGPRDEDMPVPPSQLAAAHRKALHLGVQGARDALDHLHALEPEVGDHTPIVPVDQLDDLHKLLVGILTDVENLRRRTVENHAPEEDNPESEESADTPLD